VLEWVEVIRVSSISLGEIIENMLTFCKLQSSAVSLQVSPVQISSIFQYLKQVIRTYPKSPKVQVTFQEPTQDLWVMANQVALHQVLVNVVTNSLKFTEIGEVKVSADVSDKNRIQFVVSDTGIGMNQSFVDSGLFEPFCQEEKSLTSAQRGVGLGMSLSKQMVEKMQGAITVNSVKHRGTSTTICLPSSLPQISEKVSMRESMGPSLPRKEGIKVKALIVDDNATNRKVLFHLLKHVGFESTLASSGEEAIEAVLANPNIFDVIFMDIFMPGMGGIEATARIRALSEQWSHVPMICGCTADTSEKTLQECAQGGITQFIHKPVDKKALAELYQFLCTRNEMAKGLG